jgi:hypothetical protein
LALAKFRHNLPAKMRMKLSGYTKPSSW